MTMGKKLHIYVAGDVTRSVLDAVPVTANCGLTKVLTRESIDKAKSSDRPTCKRCMQVIEELTKTTRIHLDKRDGWSGHLRQRTETQSRTFTFKISGSSAYVYAPEWPS